MTRWNALNREKLNIKTTENGRLHQTTFVVKDVYNIKGLVAGAGNPDWERTHKPADSHAEAVEKLLQEGGTLIGTAHTDELMFSLNGENYHYGTPVNPRSSERIPGGSSSGSAVAVAADLADIAIGTDTGGSVRIPSSYCGVYGLRPTHGAVSVNGLIPLAESFDTVGWMARTSGLLHQAGEVLIDRQENNKKPFQKLLISEDVLSIIGSSLKEAFSIQVEVLEDKVGKAEMVILAEEGLEAWLNAFRTIQGYEIWQNHGKWIMEVKPRFGPDIARRFEWASTIKEKDVQKAFSKKAEIQKRMEETVGEDGLLVMPSSPGVAPLLNEQGKGLEIQRKKMLQMMCISGLTGFPQLSLPYMEIDGLPVGLSIMAGANQDRRLLEWISGLEAQSNDKQNQVMER